MPDNPYIDRGVVMSEEEHQLVSVGLTALAESASQKGDPSLHNKCVKLIVRLKQCVHAGEGLTPEVAERYGRRIARAIELGNGAAVERGVADLMAASLRLDPDPAEKVGVMLSQLARTSAAETAKANCIAWLKRLVEILGETNNEFARDGFPSGKVVLEWVIEVVGAGLDDVRAGHAPWSEAAPEQDVEAANAEQPA